MVEQLTLKVLSWRVSHSNTKTFDNLGGCWAESFRNLSRKMKLYPLFIVFALLTGCGPKNPTSKYEAFVYKQPSPDGLICVFHSNTPAIAEQNAQSYAEDYRHKYGITLTVRSTPFNE
jgi:hypothetical protein